MAIPSRAFSLRYPELFTKISPLFWSQFWPKVYKIVNDEFGTIWVDRSFQNGSNIISNHSWCFVIEFRAIWKVFFITMPQIPDDARHPTMSIRKIPKNANCDDYTQVYSSQFVFFGAQAARAYVFQRFSAFFGSGWSRILIANCPFCQICIFG